MMDILKFVKFYLDCCDPCDCSDELVGRVTVVQNSKDSNDDTKVKDLFLCLLPCYRVCGTEKWLGRLLYLLLTVSGIDAKLVQQTNFSIKEFYFFLQTHLSLFLLFVLFWFLFVRHIALQISFCVSQFYNKFTEENR